jgi:CRISPR/Cas system CMR subunit Cmr4 (Cas7 group RAMP superfamily)
MSALIPVPSTAGQFMLVTCSPNLPRAEDAYELFDAITSMFHFVASERLPRSGSGTYR